MVLTTLALLVLSVAHAVLAGLVVLVSWALVGAGWAVASLLKLGATARLRWVGARGRRGGATVARPRRAALHH